MFLVELNMRYIRVEFAVQRRLGDEHDRLHQVAHLRQQVQHDPQAEVGQGVVYVYRLQGLEADQTHPLALASLVDVPNHHKDQR